MIENTKPGKEGVRLVRVTSALLRQNHMEEYLGEVLTRSIVRLSGISAWKKLRTITGESCPEMFG